MLKLLFYLSYFFGMVMYANEVEKWKLPEIKKINFNTYICQDKTHVC